MSPWSMLARLFRGAEDVALEVRRPINPVVAFFVSFLPRRYWGGADGVGILLSALFQAGGSLAGLVNTYTAYAQQVSDGLAEATLAAAISGGAERLSAAPAMAFGALTPLGFFAVSAPAWVFAYSLFSGLIRALGYATDHPCGDPILTFADDLVWDAGRGVRSKIRQAISALRSFWNR